MNNTIQLYMDEKQEIKGYPITSPDRVIDENGVNIKEQLDNKASITKANDLQNQINKLVLGAVGDGNNAEVVQARGEFEVLNDRLDFNDNLINKFLINKQIDYSVNIGLFQTSVKGINTTMGGKYTMINVYEKDVYYISGQHYNDDFKLVSFMDNSNNLIDYSLSVSSGWLDNVCVRVPTGATKMYVNGITSKSPIVFKLEPFLTVEEFTNCSENLQELNNDRDFKDNCIKERLLFESKKNPFKFSQFDKGYVSFVFDDGRSDLDLVASIFKDYNVPLCIALPPTALNTICNGLSSDSNGFSVGMTVKNVAKQVVINGGEVLSHGFTVITENNYLDDSVMKSVFYDEKIKLENEGFTIKGIIANGGTGALYPRTNPTLYQDAFEKWLLPYYNYSDVYGVTENYNHQRFYWGTTEENCKTQILNAKNNKKWVSFMCHTLANEGGYGNETMLRNLLNYCKEIGVEVVTYNTIHSKFASSKLEQLILQNP